MYTLHSVPGATCLSKSPFVLTSLSTRSSNCNCCTRLSRWRGDTILSTCRLISASQWALPSFPANTLHLTDKLHRCKLYTSSRILTVMLYFTPHTELTQSYNQLHHMQSRYGITPYVNRIPDNTSTGIGCAAQSRVIHTYITVPRRHHILI